MLEFTPEQSHNLGRPSAGAGAVLAHVGGVAGWSKPRLAGSFAGIPGCEISLFPRSAKLQIGDDYADASLDHPAIGLAAELLATWPEQLAEAAFLWSRIYPIQRANLGDDRSVHGYGCTCGGVAGAPFEVYATVYDPLGFLEGIVHEFGHWKLHTLGVHLMTWPTAFLENDFEELYESPIRKDIERPMGAVVHAHYSYLHVTEIALRRLEHDVAGFPDEPAYVDGLRRNLERMIEGHATLAASARPGELGRGFFDNVGAWGLDVIERAERMLGRLE